MFVWQKKLILFSSVPPQYVNCVLSFLVLKQIKQINDEGKSFCTKISSDGAAFLFFCTHTNLSIRHIQALNYRFILHSHHSNTEMCLCDLTANHTLKIQLFSFATLIPSLFHSWIRIPIARREVFGRSVCGWISFKTRNRFRWLTQCTELISSCVSSSVIHFSC